MSTIKQAVAKVESILGLTLEKVFKPGTNCYKAVSQDSYTLAELEAMSEELMEFGFEPQLATPIYDEILYLVYEGITLSIYTDAEIYFSDESFFN